MISINKKVLVLLWFISCFYTISAQDIWPGDINNNGIVNGVDVLYLGLGYDATGPEREDGSSDWEAQSLSTPWGQNFPDGTNFAYGDCNGDGVIDEDDLEESIEENFGLTHGTLTPDVYANGTPGAAPPLTLVPSTNFVLPGEALTIDVFLGDENFPVGDFYGITFTIQYDEDLIEDDEEDDFEFELTPGSWIDPTGEDESETIFIETAGNQAEIAITRIDQQAISNGFGKIAAFSIIIEDIIVGLEVDTFNLEIIDVKMIDVDLNTFAVVPDETSVVVAKDSSFFTDTEEVLANEQLTIFPNPAVNDIYFQTDLKVETVKLYNTLGQEVSLNWTSNSTAISLPKGLLGGVYTLHFQCKEGILRKRVIIQSTF